MSEWEEYKFVELISMISEKTSIANATLQNYISTDNMIGNFGGVVDAEKLPKTSKVNTFQSKDVLFSNIRTYFKKVWLSNFHGTVSADVIVFRSLDKSILSEAFLYYTLCNSEFIEYTVLTSRGAKMPRGDKDAIRNFDILLPPIYEQKAIAEVLTSLDDKIDLLHRQNQTLEQMTETLFMQWFVEEADEGWEERTLSSIATFLNGLACQKFPPKNENEKLPVLKIKQLRNGIGEDCDWCTPEVDPKYIVENGDVIFAWSASLMVKIWDGETCILNQHLFKVTSEEFPKWYYYLWSKFHLAEFIAIAKGHATTMGHIKRGDLDEAMVLVPSWKELDQMTIQFEPLIEKLIENNKQITTLENLRDSLLPKLMSGDVRVEI